MAICAIGRVRTWLQYDTRDLFGAWFPLRREWSRARYIQCRAGCIRRDYTSRIACREFASASFLERETVRSQCRGSDRLASSAGYLLAGCSKDSQTDSVAIGRLDSVWQSRNGGEEFLKCVSVISKCHLKHELCSLALCSFECLSDHHLHPVGSGESAS